MQNLILVAHILVCIVMTGLVLLQKSEGGGLGMGGGGGNSLMSGRGAAGALVRTTILLGGIFFLTSLTLTSIANREDDSRTDVEKALGASEDTDGFTAPTDLFDPSAPLLQGQDGGATGTTTPDATPPAEPAPAAPTTDETPAPAEPDSGNPQ
ncbi:preprotein translocase subunit SecG [Hyphomonas johnsonii]|jgi:preprotein translocase subunit SecG|uniref:Protein-export membrane protein SecG n=1 Tax=Hyphomonas johnsonii MHS-2 TaxID=1280950 RepID=A0A059FUM6_9PROT|nr:preprotein translocase subunit SecG [Hyphomonas johnsonii]KCZ94395.1 preprotein translocase subunit SecG [Hyphomonas johnsonii MHS-2]